KPFDLLLAPPMGPSAEPAVAGPAGDAAARRSAARPHRVQPDTRRPGVSGVRDSRRFRGSALAAIRSGAQWAGRGAYRRIRLVRRPWPARRTGTYLADGVYQRSVRVPVQAPGRPRRCGARPAAFVSAVRLPGRARIRQGSAVSAGLRPRLVD